TSIFEQFEIARMLEEVLDLDSDIVGQRWPGFVQGRDQGDGVFDAVEEIRVAESNMLGTGTDLAPDVLDHNFRLDDPKAAAIDWHDGTVAALVFASTAGLSVSHGAARAVGHCKGSVFFKGREAVAIRDNELLPVE